MIILPLDQEGQNIEHLTPNIMRSRRTIPIQVGVCGIWVLINVIKAIPTIRTNSITSKYILNLFRLNIRVGYFAQHALLSTDFPLLAASQELFFGLRYRSFNILDNLRYVFLEIKTHTVPYQVNKETVTKKECQKL